MIRIIRFRTFLEDLSGSGKFVTNHAILRNDHAAFPICFSFRLFRQQSLHRRIDNPDPSFHAAAIMAWRIPFHHIQLCTCDLAILCSTNRIEGLAAVRPFPRTRSIPNEIEHSVTMLRSMAEVASVGNWLQVSSISGFRMLPGVYRIAPMSRYPWR